MQGVQRSLQDGRFNERMRVVGDRVKWRVIGGLCPAVDCYKLKFKLEKY